VKKELIIVSGANGSGKTTFASLYSKNYNLEFLNTDINFLETNSQIKAGIEVISKK